MKSMQERGIELVYGRWLIEGAPRVLLINTGTGYKYLNESSLLIGSVSLSSLLMMLSGFF